LNVKRIPSVTGKAGEIAFISALLDRGFVNVFTPIVDVGIDVVAEKFTEGNAPKYFAFQVKTSTLQKSGTWYWYVDRDGFRCSRNNFYVFIFENSHNIPVSIRDLKFNALIVPSHELNKAHWRTDKKSRKLDVNISISPNMLKNPKKYRSGWLRFFNNWKQLK